MSEFSPEDRNMCGFCTKYLPTCEFHCWALSTTEGAFCRQMTDWLCVKNHIFFLRATFTSFFLFTFQSVVGLVFFTLATVWLICLCTCAHNFRQTTLLIIKAEIYHQIKMINIFFVLSVLSLSDPVELINYLAPNRWICSPFREKNPYTSLVSPKYKSIREKNHLRTVTNFWANDILNLMTRKRNHFEFI